MGILASCDVGTGTGQFWRNMSIFRLLADLLPAFIILWILASWWVGPRRDKASFLLRLLRWEISHHKDFVAENYFLSPTAIHLLVRAGTVFQKKPDQFPIWFSLLHFIFVSWVGVAHHRKTRDVWSGLVGSGSAVKDFIMPCQGVLKFVTAHG